MVRCFFCHNNPNKYPVECDVPLFSRLVVSVCLRLEGGKSPYADDAT